MRRPPRIKSIKPGAAIAGGKVVIEGTGFDPDEVSSLKITFNGLEARPVLVSKTRIVTIVPDQADKGPVTVSLGNKNSNAFDLILGTKIADNVNPVDSPLFDRAGNLYITFSGKRGETVPVSVFKIDVQGSMTPFLSNIPNATSLAMDRDENLYISSRFEGTVYKASPKADVTIFAKDLGLPTGIVFDDQGFLYVGDRNGRILKISPAGDVVTFAEIPESMVAFHLAIDLQGNLLVSNPGTSSHNSVLMVDLYGKVIPLYGGFGRPQGITVDREGNIYVCEAKAGESAIYKITPSGEKTTYLTGPVMVGLAFDNQQNLAVATPDTVYLVRAHPLTQ
jgi:sugar lactone lactonase YvrE